MTERRWDVDDRGTGIADGAAFAPGVERLVVTMREPEPAARSSST